MRFYKNPGWIHLDARGPPQIKMDDKKSMPDPLPVINLRVEQSIENSLLTLRFLWTNPTDYSSYMVYGLRTATGTKNSRYDGDYIEETMQVYSGLDPTVAYTFTVQRGNDAGYSEMRSLTTTATPFDPRSVAGLYFWGDAADPNGNGLFIEDSEIYIWKDKSGKSNHAFTTAAALSKTDSIGRYLSFDGTGNGYNLADSSWINGQYYTFFIVDRANSALKNTLIGTQEPTNEFGIMYEESDGSAAIVFSTSGVDNNLIVTELPPGYADANTNIWCFTNYGGKKAYWYNALYGINETAYEEFLSNPLLTIGGTFAPYNGKMREVLLYRGIMSDKDRGSISNYLNAKWVHKPALIPALPVTNGCMLWLDAQDTSTMFEDASGLVPISSGSVLLWKDKSGMNNHSLGSLYLGVISDVVGDLGGAVMRPISFGQLTTPSILMSGNASFFIVAVPSGGYTPPVMDSGSEIFSGFFKIGEVGLFSFSQGPTHSPGVRWCGNAANTNDVGLLSEISDPFIFYGTVQDGITFTGEAILPDGTLYKNTHTGNVAIKAGSYSLSLGMFRSHCEIIYYNRVLTEKESRDTLAYLINKWGFVAPNRAAFSPLGPGLALWLDSSDPYTVFQNDGVSEWKNRFGNNSAIAATGTKPTLGNGIVLDGSSHFDLSDGLMPTGEYSYFVVAKPENDGVIINSGEADIKDILIVSAMQLYSQQQARYDSYIQYTLGESTGFISFGVDIMLGGCRFITYANGMYVAGGDGSRGEGDQAVYGNPLAYSYDGLNWVAESAIFGNGKCTCAAYASNNKTGGTWAVGGSNLPDSTTKLATSTNGVFWTPITTPPSGDILAIAYGIHGGLPLWVAGTSDGIYYSGTLQNWLDASGVDGVEIFSEGCGTIVYGKDNSGADLWVATGYDTVDYDTVAYSRNGMTWTLSESGGNVCGRRNDFAIPVAYHANTAGNVIWVAGGDSIAYSYDGMTWVAANLIDYQMVQSVAHDGTRWLAQGIQLNTLAKTLLTSSDGINWVAPYTHYESINPNFITPLAVGGTAAHNQLRYVKTRADKATTTVAGCNKAIVFNNDTSDWGTQKYACFEEGNCYTIAYGKDNSGTPIWMFGGGGIGGTIPYIISSSYSFSEFTVELQNQVSSTENMIYAIANGKDGSGNNLWLAAGNFTNVIYSSNGDGAWNYSTTSFGDTCYSLLYYEDPSGYRVWFAGIDAPSETTISVQYSLGGAENFQDLSVIGPSLTKCLSIAHGKDLSGNDRWVFAGISRIQSFPPPDNPINTPAGGSYYLTDLSSTQLLGGANYIFTVQINSVHYANGIWVAAGEGDCRLGYSYDGNAWIPSYTGNIIMGTRATSVTYNGREWVAVGGVGTPINARIAYSTNGIEWTETPLGVAMPDTIYTVAANPVPVVSRYAQTIYDNSIKGIAWIVYGNMAPSYGSTLFYSSNRRAFNNPANDPFLNGICNGIVYGSNYGNPLWVAVGTVGPGISTSSDGINWRAIAGDPGFYPGYGSSIAYNGSQWVAAGVGTTLTFNILSSTDGITWTRSPVDASENTVLGTANQNNGLINTFAYGADSDGKGMWMCGGTDICGTATFASSYDGVHWTAIEATPFTSSATPSTFAQCYTLLYGKDVNGAGLWMAHGRDYNGGLIAATSPDRLTWSPVGQVAEGQTYSRLSGIGWNGSYWMFLFVRDRLAAPDTIKEAVVTTSTDLILWTSFGIPLNDINEISDYRNNISWMNDTWTIIGQKDSVTYIETSTDAITWTTSGVINITGTAKIANGYHMVFSKMTDITDSTPIPDSNIIIESLHSTDYSEANTYLSGIPSSSNPTITDLLIVSPRGNTIGRGLVGSIQEIILYNGVVNRTPLENYLKKKWNTLNYSPKSVAATMGLWLDADRSNIIFGSKNSIQTWKDKSGAGTDMTQLMSWAQPLYSLDPVTGKYGVQFGSQGLRTGFTNSKVSPWGSTNRWSIFAVQRYDYSTSDPENAVYDFAKICTLCEVVGSATDVNPTFMIATQTLGPTYAQGQEELSFRTTNESKSISQAEMHKRPVLTSAVVGEDLYMYASSMGADDPSPVLSTPMQNNSYINIGFTGGPDNIITTDIKGAMRGYIYEMIIFKTAISLQDQSKVEGYLAWKWGINDLLVPTHPYYFAPPPSTPPSRLFAPLDISGATLWLDGADADTVILDNAQVVQEWRDKSGLGNGAGLYIGYPSYNNAIVFDGGTAFNLGPSAFPYGDSSYSIYVVVTITSSGSTQGIIGGGLFGANAGDDLTNKYLNIVAHPSGSLSTSWESNDIITPQKYYLGKTTLFSSLYESGGARTQFIHGANGGSDTPSTRLQASGGNTLGITSNNYFFNGTIKEVLVYDTKHSTAERQKIEGYLAWKWDTNYSLPTTHPYFSGRPYT